jgi:hypothetical protein
MTDVDACGIVDKVGPATSTCASRASAIFPETVESQPELLAHHLEQAGFTERAIDYLRRAGSIVRSANAEAIVRARRTGDQEHARARESSHR